MIDPLSKAAQKIAPILIVHSTLLCSAMILVVPSVIDVPLVIVVQSLVNSLKVTVKVVLNPRRDLAELPLKTFYRYVLQDQLLFDKTGMYVT